MDILRKVQEHFKRFPGIGERQAMRFAYFLATADEGYVRSLTDSIAMLRASVKRCNRCYALNERLVNGLCLVCLEPKTDKSLLLVVEKDADRDRFLKARTYDGTYFVLGGLAPAIEREVDAHIRIKELRALAEKEAASTGLKEIILALSATPDGDRTEALLIQSLRPLAQSTGVGISILGKGLSTGTEIEYSDKETLANALRSRTQNT
jgi:recombination protein RecR